MSEFAQGRYEVDIEEIEYLRHGAKPFLARVFRPRGTGPFPAVIDCHGGAWCGGDRKNNDTVNAAVASGGVVIASLDFRCPPPDAPYPGSVADVNYGIRWLKSQATRFGSSPEMVGSMGTSSGGHLVVLAALKPTDPRYATVRGPNVPAVDASVPFVVSLWPVICPLSRYRVLSARIAEGKGKDNWRDLMAKQETYWITEDAMEEGSPNFAVQRGDAIALPNILYMQNPADPLHPHAHLESFVEGFRKAGGHVQLELFEGENYDQIRSDPSSVSAREAVEKIITFVYQQAEAGTLARTG